MPISEEKVRNAIHAILAEMFTKSLEHKLSLLVLVFNHAFNTGQFPSTRTGADKIIVPIYNSGDKDYSGNYRGVLLLCVLEKTSAHILNERLTQWADENYNTVEERSGFRADHFTVHSMFAFHATVQRYLLKKSGKVYVCFVDFKNALDTINRSVLCNMLRKSGVGEKMLRILQTPNKMIYDDRQISDVYFICCPLCKLLATSDQST